MVAKRDPVSELFDGPARRLLERAYRQRGVWVSTRVADPGPRHVAWAAGLGINVLGPDNAATLSGRRQDMRSRWMRGYVRSLYYVLKWYGPTSGAALRSARRTTPMHTGALRVRVGPRLTKLGVIPAGRKLEVMIDRGGSVAARAVARLDDEARIWTDEGGAGGRFSLVEGRDW